MYLVGMRYVFYEPGDEEIILGTQITSTEEDFLIVSNKLYPPYPNPSSKEVSLGFALTHSQHVSIQIFDIKGQLVKVLIEGEKRTAGLHQDKFELKDLQAGQYIIQLKGENFQLSEKMVIVR